MPVVDIDIVSLDGTYLGSFGFKENGSEKKFRADFFRGLTPENFSKYYTESQGKALTKIPTESIEKTDSVPVPETVEP